MFSKLVIIKIICKLLCFKNYIYKFVVAKELCYLYEQKGNL